MLWMTYNGHMSCSKNCETCRIEAVWLTAYHAYLWYMSRLIKEQLSTVDDTLVGGSDHLSVAQLLTNHSDSSASRVRHNILNFHKLTYF